MKGTTPRIAIVLSVGLLLSASRGLPASTDTLSGSISGWVTNPLGIPQMGAVVMLYNQNERLVSRATTDETGVFLFDALRPDLYSIRVSLASFLPSLKKSVLVQPGMRSLLSVNLAGMLSSIELVYSATGTRSIMSEDWKWALRTSSATRPVLRFLPGVDISDPGDSDRSSAIFSGTHGMVKVSAGDTAQISAFGNEPDLGTAFALATSLFGANQLQVSGNVGYTQSSGMPSAGFSTRYSRGLPDGSNPEVQVTMRQLSLPTRAGLAFVTGQEGGAPQLRTMSVSFSNQQKLGDDIQLDYGVSLESVSFLERLNFFSPYVRLAYGRDETGVIELGYSSGLPPLASLASEKEQGPGLQQDLATLATFPRVSLLDGRATVQRTENFEVGYRRTVASRTYSVAAYRESVTNGTVTMVGPPGYPSSDVLPDMSSNSSVFNLGDYASLGYMGAVTQAMGEHLGLTLGAGSGGALVADGEEPHSGSPDELRRALREEQRYWAALKLSASLPRTGTKLATSYRWSDRDTLNPGHYYMTQTLRPDAGLNIYLRQCLPALAGLPGRLELTADLRNLLKEGYVPISTADGRRVLLMRTPRSVRGGLSFSF